MNRVFLIGNLVADPELRYAPDGKAVAEFRIALNEGKDREATFLDVVAWEKLGESVAEFQRKGSKVAVLGQIKVEKWQDKETGKPRTAYRITAREVEFLSPKPATDHNPDAPAPDQDEGLPF